MVVGGFRQVASGVWVAIGYSLANSMLLEAPDALIVVDTTESIDSARKVAAEFRKLRPEKRVRTIVYTHNHADHTFGAEVGLSQKFGLNIHYRDRCFAGFCGGPFLSSDGVGAREVQAGDGAHLAVGRHHLPRLHAPVRRAPARLQRRHRSATELRQRQADVGNPDADELRHR